MSTTEDTERISQPQKMRRKRSAKQCAVLHHARPTQPDNTNKQHKERDYGTSSRPLLPRYLSQRMYSKPDEFLPSLKYETPRSCRRSRSPGRCRLHGGYTRHPSSVLPWRRSWPTQVAKPIAVVPFRHDEELYGAFGIRCSILQCGTELRDNLTEDPPASSPCRHAFLLS